MVVTRPGGPGGITQPGFPSTQPSIEELVNSGAYVRTNRDNQGSWRGYLNALQKTPNYTAGNATFFETPADRAKTQPRPMPLPGKGASGVPTRGGSRANTGAKPTRPPGGRPVNPTAPIGAAQETPAGTPEANYAAGLRTYGLSGRSAPNVGAVRNKAGYNERDRRVAARNSRANLATGDEMSRVRLLGG